MKINLTSISLLAGVLLMVNATQSFAQQEIPMQGKQQGMKKPPKRPDFSELDLDSDGNISLEEFKQHKNPHPTPEEIFAHIDANGDGQISEQEFTSHKPPARPPQR
jgi:hypothetical protein